MFALNKRPIRALAALGALALPLSLIVTISPAAIAAPVVSTNRLYTLDADFNLGALQDVNHDAPNNNQLQLNRTQTFFPYVNVAQSGLGTMVRINVNTGEVIGEWLTAPAGRFTNPSRTTVDRLGNTWVSNRDESTDFNGDGNGDGSVTRVGVISGGTRSNADGTANPAGDYLKPPFGYNTCKDRDLDGLIATSRGLNDFRPWTNAGGVDNDGGVQTAADECIITYTRVNGAATRTVAVDALNNLWTGGLDNDHEKLDGVSGDPVAGTQFNLGCGGYGGLIGQDGALWSALVSGSQLRFDPNPTPPPAGTGVCLPGATHGDYGLGMDPNTGEIWHTNVSGNRVAKLAPNGTLINAYPHGSENAQGVAVDKVGNVWVAHSLLGPATTVGHIRTDGTPIGNVSLPGGAGPTGVAVDTNGKVWVTNYNTHNVMRIDPSLGPIVNGFHVGAVDLTVPLRPNAFPYNYSDMTGSVLGVITAPIGTWTVVQDSGQSGQPWGKVTWNTEPQGTVPAATSITVEARTADTEAGLGSASFVPASNGVQFGLIGRFIEVRATLRASPAGASPILSDIRIETADRNGIFSCIATVLRIAGLTSTVANPPDVPCVDDTKTLAQVQLSAGVITVRLTALNAVTSQTPDNLNSLPAAGDNSTATATVATTRITSGLIIPLVTIELGVIASTASATCQVGPGGGLAPLFTGSSHIASLRINGVAITVGSAPLTIPLVIGSLQLNSTTTTGTSVTQRAVFLDTILTDVVIGEAKANVEAKPGNPGGTPCAV
jgi:streptogramin lyase